MPTSEFVIVTWVEALAQPALGLTGLLLPPPAPALVAPPLLEPPLLEPATWLPPLTATAGAPARAGEPATAGPPAVEPPAAGAEPSVAFVAPALAGAPAAPAPGPSPSEVDEHATAKTTAPSAKNAETEQFIKIFSISSNGEQPLRRSATGVMSRAARFR